ncbi:hypothetical protein ANANG_G00033790 [Anguilla anguilla]|uniref:G-protein coupled receptors family 3 profile domain-containing protein n=1 Tax=Anguilla anguilla TaxID=7936 RepID=A0A9D3S434_ANGAN|nr:hypothetical protein ANANG_G00033790 [Anguilla anguilla]
MSFSLVLLLLLLSLADRGSSQMNVTDSPPRGCGPGLGRPYALLCDLEAVWGVVLESVAGGGVLACLLLGGVLLGLLRRVSEPERRSGVGLLLLLLAGAVGLFGLSFAFLIESGEALCVVRRALWGALFALCFSCLLGIVAAEWILLTVAREGQPACLYQPLDFALACSYVAALLLAATLTARPGAAREGAALAPQRRLALRLAAAAPPRRPRGPLLPAPRPPARHPDYFDTSQPPPRLRETSFDEDLPLSHRPYMENHAFSFDEHSAALRPGYRNSNIGLRNSGVPFRSNVYQPTEMAVVLNGGTIPSAPPNYTGRPQW